MFDLPEGDSGSILGQVKSRKIPLTTFAPEIMIDSELIPNHQVEITQELGRGKTDDHNNSLILLY